jgi:DNA polymerase-3 subunit beta
MMVKMKFTVSQSDLNQALAAVSKAISNRPSRPVLGNVLLSVADDTLTLTGFDESMGIQRVIPIEPEHGGSFTPPAKLFLDIVSRLPDAPLVLEMEDSTMKITSLAGSYEIRGTSAEDYPRLPEVTGEAFALAGDDLLAGIGSTLYSVSDDETKMVLCGVHISTTEETLEWASTDGHRLSVLALEHTGTGFPEVTVPAKALREVERMVAHLASPEVKLVLDESQARFEVAGQVIITRLLEGQYPNYRQLIPKQFSKTVTVERKALVTSLGRVAVLAAQKNDIVELSIAGQFLTLSADATETGSGSETLPVQTTGVGEDDLFVIAFNVKYLLDALKALASQDVTINLNSPTSPVVLSPVSGDRMTALVMPVQIKK